MLAGAFIGGAAVIGWVLIRLIDKKPIPMPGLPVLVMLAIVGAAWMFRYDVVPTNRGDVYRLDRWTGQTEICRGGTCKQTSNSSDRDLARTELATPAPAKKVIVDRCTGTVVTGSESPPCEPVERWKHITVPDFLKEHPDVQQGSEIYEAVDNEVGRLRASYSDPFDPEILNEAYRNVTGTKANQ